MKLALQYLSDVKLSKYKQIRKIKSDLTEAFVEVAVLKNSKDKKPTLADFLNTL